MDEPITGRVSAFQHTQRDHTGCSRAAKFHCVDQVACYYVIQIEDFGYIFLAGTLLCEPERIVVKNHTKSAKSA